jgi:hypothetical protein
MDAFRWVTSSDPKVVAGSTLPTIKDYGIKVGIHGDGVHIAPLNPGQQLKRAEALRLLPTKIGGSCAWKKRSARSRRANWQTSRCGMGITLPCPDAESKQIRSVMAVVNGKSFTGRTWCKWRATHGFRGFL